jgi:hypothetical protein
VVRAKKEEEDEEARQEMWKDWARDDNRPANEPSHPDMTEEDSWPKTGWAKTVVRAACPLVPAVRGDARGLAEARADERGAVEGVAPRTLPCVT